MLSIVLLLRRLRFGYTFRRIPLTQGKYTIVDPDDFDRLNNHKWHISRGKGTFYAVRTTRLQKQKKRVVIKMHRQILKVPDDIFVDHINHNGLDNRKANLRPATCTQNNRNRRKLRPRPQRTCLDRFGLNGHLQVWTLLCWSPALEAAIHSLLILLGGSLKAEGFGDGFPWLNTYAPQRGQGRSKYKGLTWYKHEKRWAVRIMVDRESKFIGYFDNEIDAAMAYDKAARKYHGEFAVLNFPETLTDTD